MDLDRLLYYQDSSQDKLLEDNNVIIIPFRQLFVIVSGAVSAPGRFPYIPDRTYEYYVNLAGGFDPNRHLGSRVIVTDINNKRVSSAKAIQPESKIVAPNNNPLFIITRAASIISAITSVVVIVISLMQ